MEQTIKTNRQIADAWQEVVDSKQFDNLVKVDASNFKMTNPFGIIEGVEGHKQFLTAFATYPTVQPILLLLTLAS